MQEQECRSEISMVWAVGGNTRGQLGLGHASSSNAVPSTVAFKLAPHQRIVEVFCGYEHTFALTSDGDVLGFGNGIKGQLGIGNTDSHSRPQRVHLLCGKGVVKMAAGLEHSLALTESGDLYSFGDNLSGQLGLGHNFTAKEQTPQKVPPFSKAKVMQMACGQDHTAVITSSGELFTFGNNRFGALGLPGHNEEGPPIVASNPQLVSTLSGKCIVQIGCGLQHTVALTRAGHVYTWGHNSRGQLGTGDTKDRFTPSQVCKPLSAAKCIHVACGGQHTLALTEHDDVFGFGSDRHGQLGLGQGGYIFPVPSRIVRLGGRRVQHCVGGAWHTAIRTDTGDNYVMGCILPAAESGDESNPAPLTAPRNELNRRSSRATATGAATPSDPFALSYGGFRRLMLPRGSEACSKGHSLFYGPGLGAPPGALRKVVKSLVRLKADLSRMLVQQKPDVVFTESMAASSSYSRKDAGGMVAEAHLAVLRARCPRLFTHAAAAIRNQVGEVKKPREMDGDGRPVAWRVPSFPGVSIDALQLLIAYLYQDAGVFDKQQEKQQTPTRDKDGVEEVLVPAPAPAVAAAAAPGSSSSLASSPSAHFPSPTSLDDNASLRREPDRMRERRERLSMRARARSTGGGGEEMSHGTIKATMEPFEGEMHGHGYGYGEDETAAGFGSFGNAYGSPGEYDGAGLDRLMAVMAAARKLGLTRLQGLCEKRAEAFIDCPTVHKVLRRAADGGFPYLKRRCLEFCLTRLSEVCAPENSGEVVRELSQHPSVLADVLSLAAASDGAKQAAAREVSYHGAGKAPCIETLSKESPCPVPVEGYQEDFLRLFETVARASVAGELHRHEEAHEEAATPRSAVTATKTWTVTATTDGPPARRRFEGDVWESKEEEAARNRGNVDQDAGGMTGGSDPLDPVEARRCTGRKEVGKMTHQPTGDFKIRAGEGMPAVTVHRCILAARSGFFRALLEGGMGDAKEDELILRFEPVVCLKALLELLRFLYTGRTGVMEPLTALDVLFLTKGEDGSGGFFQITANDDLRAFCKSTIINGINSANALPILVRAKALGDEETMETAIAFTLDNFDACMSPREERECKDSCAWLGGDAMPACLADDESPVVDLLLAMAKRCTVTVNASRNRLGHATSSRAPGRG
ncbi:unnamed protein product [Ascophyllum nodosum]